MLKTFVEANQDFVQRYNNNNNKSMCLGWVENIAF